MSIGEDATLAGIFGVGANLFSRVVNSLCSLDGDHVGIGKSKNWNKFLWAITGVSAVLGFVLNNQRPEDNKIFKWPQNGKNSLGSTFNFDVPQLSQIEVANSIKSSHSSLKI